MENGILYKYETPKEVDGVKISLIRKSHTRIVIHTDKGVKSFDMTKDSYTEKELLDLIK